MAHAEGRREARRVGACCVVANGMGSEVMSQAWLPRARPLFGKVSDNEIARRLGVARTIVSKARRRLGIRSVRNVHPPGRPWLSKVQPLLGKLSDREIARQTGIHFKTIGEARRDLGIPALPRNLPRREMGKRYARRIAAMRRALGAAPARRVGPDRSWVPAVRHLLGRLPDSEIARQVDRHSKGIAATRRELGIVGYKQQPRVRGARKAPLTSALLRSKRSSREIARMTGIARQTIDRRRRALGVAPPLRRS